MDRYYMADFETTKVSHEDYTTARVYLWCIINIYNEKEKYYGTNMDQYLETIASLGDKRDTLHINMHNLSFDGYYIVDYIERNEIYEFNNVCNKLMKNNNYKTLIDGNSKWYQITIKKNARYISIEDSLKKIPMSVDKIAKGLHMDIRKGKLDYDREIPDDYVPTPDDIEYITIDCLIPARAIRCMFIENGYKNITIGSAALYDYRKMFHNFDHAFPQVPDDVHRFVADAYYGGLCMLNGTNKYKGNIKVIDKTSMYAYVMHSMSGCQLPIGMPEYYKGKYKNDELYPLYVQRVIVDAYVKDNHFGFLYQRAGNNMFSSHIDDTLGPIEITLTNVDLILLFKHYNVRSIKYIDGYKFKSCSGHFDKYIDKWYNIKFKSKEHGDKYNELLAKLFLVNLIGKFGTSIDKSVVRYSLDKNSILRNMDNIDSDIKSVYVAEAAFVNAYARDILLYNAMLCGGKKYVLYMDTDSLHLICDDNDIHESILIDNYDLRGWKIEIECDMGIYIRQKWYAERCNGKWEIKAAGMTESGKDYIINGGCRNCLDTCAAKKRNGGVCPYDCDGRMNVEDDFKVGTVIPGRLLPVRVQGGLLLKSDFWTIR